MLETLRGDETLDSGGFGVRLLAFALGLDFAADDEFADLCSVTALLASNAPLFERRPAAKEAKVSHHRPWINRKIS